MNRQLQIHNENMVLDKALIIANNKRVRRTFNPSIWCVQSENSKTPSKFYRVMFAEDLDAFVCDCKAFEFSMSVCKHILACAIFEGSKA